MNFSIELYEEDGQKMVYIAEECSSGCKYAYNTKAQLTMIISDAISSMIE